MKQTRQGFTLVELLVVITIIGILMGLLIPAVNAARETARRNQCSTQLKNLALAAIQHENTKGQLPGYVQKFGLFPGAAATAVDPSDIGNFAGMVPRHVKVGTWAVAILPWLDAQPTYEHWTEDRYPIRSDGAGDIADTDGVAGDGYHGLAAPNLAIMQCPSNPVSEGENGRNSYISNNGLCHTTVTGVSFAASQKRENGAFNCKYNVDVMSSALVRQNEGPKVRLDDFKDGQGNTLLFSENVQALPWHRAGLINATSLDVATGDDVAFSVETARYVHGMVWHYEDPDNANTAMNTQWNRLGGTMPVLPAAVSTFHRINGGGTTVSDDKFTKQMTDLASARQLARPSSAHVGGVNTSVADGGTRFIDDTIDYRVYQALLTPRGKSSDVPWQEFVLTDETNR